MQRSFSGEWPVVTHSPAPCVQLPHIFRAPGFSGSTPGEVAESVEGAPLLREYVPKGHQGFESLPLRHFKAIKSLETNRLERGCIGEVIRPTPRRIGLKCRGCLHQCKRIAAMRRKAGVSRPGSGCFGERPKVWRIERTIGPVQSSSNSTLDSCRLFTDRWQSGLLQLS